MARTAKVKDISWDEASRCMPQETRDNPDLMNIERLRTRWDQHWRNKEGEWERDEQLFVDEFTCGDVYVQIDGDLVACVHMLEFTDEEKGD